AAFLVEAVTFAELCAEIASCLHPIVTPLRPELLCLRLHLHQQQGQEEEADARGVPIISEDTFAEAVRLVERHGADCMPVVSVDTYMSLRLSHPASPSPAQPLAG
ncbi:hypothetical protein DQ04_02151070, partial [Trypanosoma grayi]|uniref:hypothetical protein n=1 Tax=Trypanosoma grayi TaxID=71804 RepID=UPI0004F4B0ED